MADIYKSLQTIVCSVEILSKILCHGKWLLFMK